MTQSARRGDIQGLRAIAVLIVVLFHSMDAFPGGFVGVDIFFVISGFVITASLQRELLTSGGINLGAFYLRRVRRLLPALTVMLGVVLVASALLAPVAGLKITARTGVAAVLFNANNYLAFITEGYFHPSQEMNALLHTWSLSVEEQFYFAFPLLLAVAWRLGRRSVRGLAIAMIMIAVPSFALGLFLSFGSVEQQDWAFYLAPARAWEFAVGGLLALATRRVRELRRVPANTATILAVGGLGGLLVILFAFDDATLFPGTAVLYPVVATSALLLAGSIDATNPVSRLLAISPMQWLGDLSYGWYLWHWPAIVMAAAIVPDTPIVRPLGALAGLAPAVASYYFVENPIRIRIEVPRWQTVRLAIVCLALPIVGAVVLEASTNRALQSETLAPFAKHVDRVLGCGVTQLDADTCAWDNSSDDTVVLLGDSQAGHLVEGLVVAAEDADVNLRVATLHGCPFIDLVIMHIDDPDERCADFVDDGIDQLRHLKPTRVVLSSASDRYIEETTSYLLDPHSGETARTAPEKARLWEEAFERTVDRVLAADVAVSVIHPMPRFGLWEARECAYITLVVRGEACSTEETKPTALAFRERAMDAELAVASRTRVKTVDLFDALCPSDVCRTSDDGRWRNLDSFHITVEQSVALAPHLAEAVTPHP